MIETILRGMRVLDLTQNVAGPFCTQILGDFGAEIIKIERPGTGDDTRAWRPPESGGQSSTFLALNRNKKSVCVDIATTEGQEIVRKLAADCDILIHSMRPGSAERKGLGFESLRADNPKLIYCAISAFGEIGPLRDLPGYDPLIQAFSGIMSVTGNENDAPVRVSVSLVDMGTGMWSAMGILAALIERGHTGKGMRVQTSLLETSVSWMTVFVASYLASRTLPKKLGSAMAMAAPYELFRTADGYIFVGAGNDRLFGRVCEALDRPDFAADPRFASNPDRVANRAALHDALEGETVKRPTGELVRALRAVGAPCSEMNDVAQIIDQEQVAAMGMIPPLPIPHAPEHRVVATPLSIGGQRSSVLEPPPALGAHTAEILSRLGYDDPARAELSRRGVTQESSGQDA